MKTLLRILLSLVALAVVAAVIAYADGATLPLNHSVSVEGTVEAPPTTVLAIITNVANGAKWRPEVKSVTLLPPDQGRDNWVEDLGHGQKMTFLALRTEPVTPAGNGLRAVVLEGSPSYGGTWTYEVTPGASPNQTHLHITEDGFIQPPLYRFMMVHLFGPTRNLDTYLKEIQAEAPRQSLPVGR